MSFKVLIADPSLSVRAVLRRYVESVPKLVVVGEARDGREAVRLARDLRPDTIITDADLARTDEPGSLEEIYNVHPVPMIVISSGGDRERMVATFRSLRRGAVAVFPKPTVPQAWEELGETLGETLRQLAGRQGRDTPVTPPLPAAYRAPIRLVAVGASTGGPGALAEMLHHLGSDISVPVVVVQHIAAGFEPALADWLTGETGLDVRVAKDGAPLNGGRVRLAPSGSHMTVDSGSVVRLDRQSPPVNGHRPSADTLFRSLVGDWAPHTAAILLSGMGTDGVAAMVELRSHGALTIVQDEGSSAVWGMPGSAVERGAASLVLTPAAIGDHLRELARRDDS